MTLENTEIKKQRIRFMRLHHDPSTPIDAYVDILSHEGWAGIDIAREMKRARIDDEQIFNSFAQCDEYERVVETLGENWELPRIIAAMRGELIDADDDRIRECLEYPDRWPDDIIEWELNRSKRVAP